jgi:hemerythrin
MTQGIDQARLDEEHRKLHHMLASMRAVVRVGITSPLAREALSVLGERMRQHFGIEEAIAARHGDAAAQGLLQSEHRKLLAALDGVETSLTNGRRTETGKLMDDFSQALSRHDSEVDDPLFKGMGGH